METYDTSNSFLNYPKDLVNIITIYMNPDSIKFKTFTLSSVEKNLIL